MKAKISIITCLIMFTTSGLYALPQNKTFTSSGEILPGEEWEHVYIYNDGTIVNMLGGDLDGIVPYDASIVNITGGSVNTISAHESSIVNIVGNAQIRTTWANGWSTVNIAGGDILNAHASDYVTLSMSGGHVEGSVSARDFSMMNMTGGEIPILSVSEKAVVNLRGGVISKGIGSASRSFETDVTINFYGYDMVKTSSGGKYGYGRVYGFYLDGSEFSIDLGEISQASINLIPEPATILLLSLGGLVLRTRKQRI